MADKNPLPPVPGRPNREWDTWVPRRRRGKRELSREEVMSDWYGDGAELEIEAKQKPAQPLGNLVDKVLVDLNHGDKLVLRKLMQSWQELVGAEIAKVTVPQGIQYKTLMIEVSDSVWMYRLRQEQRYLTKRIVDFCGGEVKQIRLVAGGRTARR